jgi:tetratricopeptide (TPR) repeat protein
VADLDVEKVTFCVYDLRLRGIFTAYLSEKFDKAKQLLTAADPLAPSDGPVTREKVRKVGLFFLQKAIVVGQPIWKPEVIAAAKTDRQRTALKLGALYLKSIRPEKAAAIYERFLANDPVLAPQTPGVKAYVYIQVARSYEYDLKQHGKAIETLQQLYQPEFSQEPLVAEGLVWLGTLTYNFTQDPKKAMPHLEYVIKTFPDAPITERAFYFYCLDAISAKDKPLAEIACRQFIAKYPQSQWLKHVQALLDNEVANLSNTMKGNSK